MSALDELVRSWRANPDADGTVAVCTALGGSGRRDLMDEVRGVADAWHTDNFDVMLAVGRMFLDAGAFVEAQAAFVSAGKADGRRPEAFRFLGEVLLRRGDAERAEKVFERAARLGAKDADLRIWHDRARVYTSLQKRVGLEAVAREISRTVPRAVSVAPPAMRPRGAAPAPRVGAAAVPTLRDTSAAARSLPGDDEPTAVFQVPRDDEEPTTQFRPSEPPTAPYRIPEETLEPLRSPDNAVRFAPPAPVPDNSARFAPPVPAPRAPEMESVSPVEVPSGAAHAPPPAFSATPQADFDAARNDGGELAPHEVLSHLVQVGVFEPEGGVQPAWEKAPRESGKRLWVLGIAAGLALAGAVGGTVYARKVAEQRRAEAASIGDRVAVELASGSPAEIAKTDQELSRSFDLDPARPRTALLWLENRVMHWLVRGNSQGTEAAIQRARGLNVPPEDVVFGTLAVRLSEGDVPGALALLPTWDAKTKKDGVYQMLAGLALERAGNPEALARYDAALAADSKLRIARVLRARALLLTKGATALPDALQGIDANSQEAKALTVLAALLEPAKADGANSNVESMAGSIDTEALAVPLRWIGDAYKARAALDAGKRDEARELIVKALAAVDTPDAAVRLAELALRADDRALLGKATLRAVALSPVHVPARLLVARLAAETGHFDDALKAVDGIDPKRAELVALRAVVAYERGDAVALGDAVDALPADEGAGTAALKLLPVLLVGGPLPKDVATASFGSPEILWGRHVALDVAVRRGDLDTANKLLATLDATTPPLALRKARLERFALERSAGDKAGKAKPAPAKDAAGLPSCQEDSQRALEAGPSLLVLTERVQCLLAVGDAPGARTLLEQYPAVFGTMSGWLTGLVDAAQDRLPRAKARVAALELPQVESPLALRAAVAQVLVATGDRKRGAPLVAELRKAAPLDPTLSSLPPRF